MSGAKRVVLIVLGVILGVCTVLFVLANKQPVVLKFLYWESLPIWLSLMVLASLSVGMLIGLAAAFRIVLRYRGKLRKQTARIRSIEEELISYRNQPLTSEPMPTVDSQQSSARPEI